MMSSGLRIERALLFDVAGIEDGPEHHGRQAGGIRQDNRSLPNCPRFFRSTSSLVWY